MKSASATLWNRNIYISANSITKIGVTIDTPPFFKLLMSSPLHTIGEKLAEALMASQINISHPKDYKQYQKSFLNEMGLKSYSELQNKHSKYCSIHQNKNVIEIQAYQNIGRKGFVQLKHNPIDPVFLNLTDSFDEYGRALLEGLSRSFYKEEDLV